MPIIQLASSFLCSLSQCHSLRFFLFYAHYPRCYSARFLFSMFIIPNVIRARFISSMLIIPDVIQLVSSFLCSLSQMLFSSFPLFYVYYPECYSGLFPLFYVYYPECYSGSVYLFYAHYPRCYSVRFLFSMFITANVIRSLFHCLIGQFFNCSPKLG